jgi:hypothetical protein
MLERLACLTESGYDFSHVEMFGDALQNLDRHVEQMAMLIAWWHRRSRGGRWDIGHGARDTRMGKGRCRVFFFWCECVARLESLSGKNEKAGVKVSI